MNVFIFGEAMLEYHSQGGATGLRFGGDTLNTAIHMARAGIDVAYVTAVGTDPISDGIVAAWAAEGINTSYILRHPTRTLGIYAIHVDAHGERSFVYWRNKSAAREMFDLPGMGAVLKAARKAELLYFSLISLAILPPKAQDELIELACEVRAAGNEVAYDSNFRPTLWPNLAVANHVSNRAIATATLGFPTNIDEQQLRGSPFSEAQIAQVWLNAGCKSVVVKAGEAGCFYQSADQPMVRLDAEMVPVIDTSGAGDAFNAGYLSGHIIGETTEDCIGKGQALARWVIGRKGAVPDRDDVKENIRA